MRNIRSICRRLPVLLLAAVVTVTSFCSAAVYGTQSATATTKLTNGGVTLTSTTFTGTVNESERYFTYQPGGDVRPLVAYGDTLYGRSNLDYVAAWARKQNLQLVGGINASFFDLSSGLPTGPELTGGVLRTNSDSFRGYSIGFLADGSVKIGLPNIQTAVAWPDGAPSNCHYNRVLTEQSGLVLYSRDYDTKTKNTLDAINVVLQPETDEITLGGSVSATVVSIQEAASCEIPEGCFVLSVAKDSLYQSLVTRINSVEPGDTITFTTTCTAGWEACDAICSAGDLLVWNGEAQDYFTLDSAKNASARTALGVMADGSVVLYTVDGGSKTSAGVTLAQLAQRMEELGCVSAVNLDGGGSTTLGTVSTSGAVTTQNKPSDGAQRKCANFIFLYYDIDELTAKANDALLLPGARTSISVGGVSGSGHATPAPPTVTYAATAGSFSGNVFQAPDEAGEVTLTVRSGNMQTVTQTTVVFPDAITVTNSETGDPVTELTLDTGASIDLNAAGTLSGQALTGSDDSFTWQVTEGIGTISAAGVFTAARTEVDLSGFILVSCGDVSVEIPVLVEGGVENAQTIWDFETTLPGSGSGLTVSPSTAQVRYGKRSAALQYDLSGATNEGGARQVTCSASVPLGDQVRQLGFWLYADGSGNSFSVRIEQDGQTSSLWAATMNGTGWQYVTVALPGGEKTLCGFAVTAGSGGKTTGTLYLDQVLTSRFTFSDTTPPTISVTQAGGQLTISAADGQCAIAWISVLCDGVAMDFSATDGRGVISLPTDGALHQITIRACDAVGNLASKTVTLDGTLNAPFADMAGHWAEQPVNYLAARGVLNGSQAADGIWRFRPNDPMTRQEFLKAVVYWLGIDPADYADVELPFVDTDKAGAWALDSCRAAYALGLLTGSRGADGQLYLNATATITRQEAMAILGRTQDKGYATADLAQFSDSAQVASWARDDIAAMVARGVISGAGGKLNPTQNVTRAEVAKMLFYLG